MKTNLEGSDLSKVSVKVGELAKSNSSIKINNFIFWGKVQSIKYNPQSSDCEDFDHIWACSNGKISTQLDYVV